MQQATGVTRNHYAVKLGVLSSAIELALFVWRLSRQQATKQRACSEVQSASY